ncbi:MAG: hypothetical protein U1F43_17210 [Myxococcota bacterium]
MSTRLIGLAATAVALALLVAPTPGGGVAAAGGRRARHGARVEAPARLSETGLYAPGGTTTIDPRNLSFSPQYPLWSDGAAKARWIQLPPGATIDTRVADQWQLPVGTKLWKQFSLDGRKVETRFLWRAARDQWVFASYAWDAAQSDALRVPEGGLRDVAPLPGGKHHSIPGTDDCRACHEAGPSVVLGFNALQLSDDRDPLAPHAEPLAPGMLTVRSLSQAGRLSPARPEWVATPPRIQASSPTERAALGYLAGNCGGCHNARGALAHLGLVFAPDLALAPGGVEPALATALDAAGRFVVPGLSPDSSRVVAPGAPERSALYYRMRSRHAVSQMPPLGTVLPDEAALTLVAAWIAEKSPTAPVTPTR